MPTAGHGGHGRGAALHSEVLLAQRLEQASDAQLQQLAQYRRPKWQTRTVLALAMEDEEEEDDENAEEDGENEDGKDHTWRGKLMPSEIVNAPASGRSRELVVVARLPLEVLDGASLADVRKLIATFCAAKISSRFVFATLHQLRRERGLEADQDEHNVCVETALDDDGVLTVLIPPVSSHPVERGTTSFKQSIASAAPSRSNPAAAAVTSLPPSFSAGRLLFGDVAAAIDVYVRRSDGVTLELSSFCDKVGAKIVGVSTAELTMQLTAKVLAQRVGMTEGMASILLSSPRGQSKIIKKLLSKLHLSVVEGQSGAEKELRWQWTARNAVSEKDLHVTRRTKVVVQEEDQLPIATALRDKERHSPKHTEKDNDSGILQPQPGEETGVEGSTLIPSVRVTPPLNELPVAVNEPAQVLPSKPAEEKISSSEFVKTVPVSTPPEKKKPEQSQPSKALVRKSSVDVNAVQLRSCLEIAVMRTGDDVPPCFNLQMIFIELMLRDFSSASLPLFVSEIRPALKEVYRASSQTSTPDIVIKSVDMLWAGLSVAFWESKIDQILAHFHKVVLSLVSDVRAKLTKAHIEVLELSPLPAIPDHVQAILRALAVVAGEELVEDKAIETIVHDLGLDDVTSKKRTKIFKSLLKNKSGWNALSPVSVVLLSKYVEAANLTHAFTPEDSRNFSLLRCALVAILDAVDFDLGIYVRRYVGAGENVVALRSVLWSLVTRKDRHANTTVSETGKSVEPLVAAASNWATDAGLSPEQVKKLIHQLQQQSADPVRWCKAQKDCAVLASCPRPCRLRWYIEPASSWCELGSDRYIFVGEADLAFEFAYFDFEGMVSGDSPAAQSQLVQRALTAWIGASAEATARKDGADGNLQQTRVAFGVNYRYAGHPIVAAEGIPALQRILSYPHVDSVVIGCSRVDTDGVKSVLLRFFVQDSQVQQSSWSLSTFLERIQENNELQKKIIGHGALSLIRLLALREQSKREPVVSLGECVRLGDSAAHKALDAALRAAGNSHSLVLSPRVSHFALDLIVRRCVALEYGCDYLRALRVFVQESPSNVICSFMNQRFERSGDPTLSLPDADVYDILWLLVLRRGHFPVEWSNVAEKIVSHIFFLPGFLDGRRLFQYSLQIGHDAFKLQLDGNRGLIAAVTSDFEDGHAAYFQQIPTVVQAAIKASQGLDRSPILSRFEDAVERTRPPEFITTIEGLLTRFFAVARTKRGLARFSLREDVVVMLVNMLEERFFSSAMALLAADYVSLVADACEGNLELQKTISDLQLLEHVVEVTWKIENKVIAASLIDALARFQCVQVFRQRVVHALSRMIQPPSPHQAFSLMREVVPAVGDQTKEVLVHTMRVRRFNMLCCEQHASAQECSCSSTPRSCAVSREEELAVVTRTALKFVATATSRAVTLTIASRTRANRLAASQRLLSAAIKFRKAAKIQHRVLRWLYVSKRSFKRPLCATGRAKVCTTCGKPPSFLGGFVLSLDYINVKCTSEPHQVEQDAVRVLQCFQSYVSAADLCEVLVSEFRLHRALLVLISDRSQVIRTVALDTLAELCWRSKTAFSFVSSRLFMPIWENYAVALQKSDHRCCSWTEHALNWVIARCRPVVSSKSSSSLLESSSRDATSSSGSSGRSEFDHDVDATALMIMVLSYGSENSELLLSLSRLLSSNLNQWISASRPFTHVKVLLAIQNALILAPSLASMTEMALKSIKDFQHVLTATYVNDRLGKAVASGIMWTICTCEQLRKQVAAKCSDALSSVLTWVEMASTSTLPPNISALPMLLNGIGLVATVSVDCSVRGVSAKCLEQLQGLYTALEIASHSSSGSSATGKKGADITEPTNFPFCSVRFAWATQLAHYQLLPELGSFRCLSSWDQLASRVNDQIFRFYAVLASCQVYDDSTTALALQYYASNFAAQVRRGGNSADFALKTLPLVFRSTTAAVSVEAATKKPALTTEQVSTIVDVLGATIHENSVGQMTGDHGKHGSVKMKTLRRVIMALWGLQVSSAKAQSLSHSLADELVDLLHLPKIDDKLRIAVLGLLVRMYRVHTHVGSADQSAASSISDQNQVRVLRVVMSEVPTIMELLRPLSSGSSVTKMVHQIKAWSPLSLDKSSASGPTRVGSTLHDHKHEVGKSVRWPIEVLHLLCESIFIERITLSQDYYDILLGILLHLDTKSTRLSGIQGRDEVVLAVASILRVFCRRLPLTAAQADICLHALFESDSMMTYASDLAAICHTTVQASRAIDAFICQPERRVLISSLQFISSGKLRLDVLSNCLDMISAFTKAMGELSCLEQLMLYEHEYGSAPGALFGHAVKIFQGAIKEQIEWVVIRKSLQLFQELIVWDSVFDRIIRGRKPDQPTFHPHSITRATTLESVPAQRSRTHLLDESTRAMVQMALMLVHFKHWLGDVASCFHDEVLRASAHATRVVARVLTDFREDSKEAARFLPLVSDALIYNNHHKLLGSLGTKDPMEALVYIFSTAFFDARNSLRSSFLQRELCEIILLAALDGLGHISMHHRARHSEQMTEFFTKNYSSPIFEETNPTVVAKLLRLYRRCCCNAFVYRLIRLGKTSLWESDDDGDDATFFRKLGTEFGKTRQTNPASDHLQFDLALFLAHQHIPIASISHPAAPTTGDEVAVAMPEDLEMLNKHAGDRALCLRDGFAHAAPTTSISYNAREFEGGAASVCEDPVAGSILVKELVAVALHHLASRHSAPSSSAQCTSDVEDTLALFEIISQLARAVSESSAADESSSSSASWSGLLLVTKTTQLHSSELDAILGLFRIGRRGATLRANIEEIADALAARIGFDGTLKFGLGSCQRAVAFARLWIAELSDDDIFRLLVAPRWLECILDVVSMLTFDQPGSSQCEEAFACVLELAEIASMASLMSVIQVIDHWQCSLPALSISCSASSSTKAVCGNAWQALIRPLYLHQLVSGMGWVEATLRLLLRLIKAEPHIVAERLSALNCVPMLCQLLYEQDRAVIRSALDLLSQLCTQSSPARKTFCSLVRCGATRPYQDGILLPLRASTWNVSMEPTSEAYRLQRDRDKILDLLRRQSICAGLGPDQILELSTMLTTTRIAAGETIALTQASGPCLMIVASGAVEWSLTINQHQAHQPSTKLIFYDTELVVKGGAIGTSGFLQSRGKGRYSVIEAATAANDVVCLVAREHLWSTASLALVIQLGIIRACGGWHRWLVPRSGDQTGDASQSYLRQLVNCASGHMGANQAIQDHAGDLIGLVSSSVVAGRLACADDDRRDLWIVGHVLPLIQRKETPSALRRDLCQVIAQLASIASCQEAIVSLNRARGRSDGLVVLGRAFRQCATDPVCLALWLRVAVLLAPIPAVDDDGRSRFKVLVRAMSEGDLLRLAAICLARASCGENEDKNTPHRDAWTVLLLVCHVRHRLQRLMKALTKPERITLATHAVRFLDEDAHANALPLRILAKLSSSGEFCCSLWLLGQAVSEDEDDGPDLLYLLKRSAQRASGRVGDIAHILELMANTLKTADITDAVKQEIVGWAHRFFGGAASPLQLDAHDAKSSCVLSPLCEFVCAIDWCCSHLRATAARVMARELRQMLGEDDWLRLFEHNLLDLVQTLRPRRRRVSSTLSAMRILYDAWPQSARSLEDVGQVLKVLVCGDKTQARSILKRPQCDSVLLASLRTVTFPHEGIGEGDTRDDSLLRELFSVWAFFDANRHSMDMMSHNRSSRRELEKRLQLFRGITATARSPSDEGVSGTSAGGEMVEWLMNLIVTRGSSGQISRTASNCLQNLLRFDSTVNQFVADHAQVAVLPQLFAALAENTDARVAKAQLLQQSCYLALSTTSHGPQSYGYAAAWTQCVQTVLLEREYGIKMTQTLVAILRWLLVKFTESCYTSDVQSTTVAKLIKQVLKSLVAVQNQQSGASEAAVEAALEGIELMAQLCGLKNVHVVDATVMDEFVGSVISWTSILAGILEFGPAHPVAERFFFLCLSTVVELDRDVRYARHLHEYLQSAHETVLRACRHTLLGLHRHTSDRRKVVLQCIQVVFRILVGTQKLDAQVWLQSISNHGTGWLMSLASDEFDEQIEATRVMQFLCGDNDDLVTVYASLHNPLLGLLESNLHHCNSHLRMRNDGGTCAAPVAVLLLLAHTCDLLRRLVQALAKARTTPSGTLLNGMIVSLTRLRTVYDTSKDDPGGQSSRVLAICSLIWLLKVCFKHHWGFCKSRLADRSGAVWVASVRVLISLMSDSKKALLRCVDIVTWVTRLSRDTRPVSIYNGSSVSKHEFTKLLVELLLVVGPTERNTVSRSDPRVLKSAHVLMTKAPELVGESARDVLMTTSAPDVIAHALMSIFPRFSSCVPVQVIGDCAALGLAVGVDDAHVQRLESSLLRIAESAQCWFLNATRGNTLGQDTPETCSHVIRELIRQTRLVCSSLSLWELLHSQAKVPEAGETGSDRMVLWSCVLSGLVACVEAHQLALAGELAIHAMCLVCQSRSAVPTFQDATIVSESVSRLLRLLEAAPIWQVAWLLTAFTQCVTVHGEYTAPLYNAQSMAVLPRLIDAVSDEIKAKHVLGCFHLLGSIAEILQDTVRASVELINACHTECWCGTLKRILVRVLRVRSTQELAPLALLCWALVARLHGVHKLEHAGSACIELPPEEATAVTTDGSEEIADAFVENAAKLVADQVEMLCRGPIADAKLPVAALKSLPSCSNGESVGIENAIRMPAITLLDHPREVLRVVCTWISLTAVEELMFGSGGPETIGRQFAECTSVIGDVSRLLHLADVLPNALTVVVLRLLARAMKTFRLFATPVVNTIDVSSICRLVRSNDVLISIAAMRALWQLLRNRRLCHQIVASVRSPHSANALHTTDPDLIHRAIQHAKELVYTAELDVRRLEAAYGILVQLSKAEEALDLVIVMDEFHPQAIFMDDPQSLLAAMVPSSSRAVLLQQCKLLKHLSRWRANAVLECPTALQCLGEAVLASTEPSSLLAAGAALLALVESTGGMTKSGVGNLTSLFEAQELAVLCGCHRVLDWSVRGLAAAAEEKAAVSLCRILASFASLFFHLTSSKHTLCLLPSIVSAITELPPTVLHALHCVNTYRGSPLGGDRGTELGCHHNRVDCDQICLELLRTLRRLTVAASVTHQFRPQDPVHMSEPFDMLMGLLNQPRLRHPATSSNGTTGVCLRELFLVILHVTRDSTVSGNVSTRHDVLTSVFQYHDPNTSASILLILWQVLRNVVKHALHVTEITQRLSADNHIALLSSQHSTVWSQSKSLALAVTSTLRTIAEKSSATHTLLLKFVPVFHKIAVDGAWGSPSSAARLQSRDWAPLEKMAHTLALIAHACSKQFEMFSDVLVLTEKLVMISGCQAPEEEGESRGIANAIKSVRNDSMVHVQGLHAAIEHLVCALCDLLLSFHEDETNNSYFPGYEIKPIVSPTNTSYSNNQPSTHNDSHHVQSTVSSRPSKRRHTRAHERSRAVQPAPISTGRVGRRPSISVRSKKTGVYCKGFSPPTSEVLDRILRIFYGACTFQDGRHRSEGRAHKRRGRSLDGRTTTAAQCGNSIVYVTDFFFHAAQTPSGRFLFLNPRVIQFWKCLVPRMSKSSLRQLCDGLVVCTLSKDHTLGFLTSGALRLLVTATCAIVRGFDNRERLGSGPLPMVDDALLQFVVAAAVLTERAPFLQCTYYLVHAGAKDHATVASLVLGAIIYSTTAAHSSFLKLACKVLSRFLTLFTLQEAAAFLESCPTQLAQALGWTHIGEHDVLMALTTMLEQTESEALMKHRVLVKVVHSTLRRTAILGLIDKGIPEVLHDYGLKTMMLHMQTLLAACGNLHDAKNVTDDRSHDTVAAHPSNELLPHHQNSFSSAVTKTPVEKLAAGLTAVGGAAITAGVTLLGTTFQDLDHDDQGQATDPHSRFSRRLEACVDALRDVTSEIAEYTETGYTTVFKSFEHMNGDLELIAAMQSSSHSIALTQAAFYVMEILQEALTAAQLDADDDVDDTEVQNDITSLQANDSVVKGPTPSGSSGGRATLTVDSSSVLETLEDVLGWITMSLQHSDMDVLFYGNKLMQLGSYVDALMRLPLDDDDDEDDDNSGPGNTSEEKKRTRGRRPSIAALKRQRGAENFPVFLRFRSLELRSWLWSVLGFLPYLRVRRGDQVQLIRFSQAEAASGSSEDSLQRLRDVFRDYVCHFAVQGPEIDHVETSYRDLPHTVDIEVWIYLPFWYRDVLVSHAKVPLLTRSMESDTFTFQFYPESKRGVRAYQPQVIGTLAMTMTPQRSSKHDTMLPQDNDFPAYSTLGSRLVRRFVRFVWSRVFSWTSGAVTTVAEVTQVNKLVEAATTAVQRRRHTLAAATALDLSDSLENDRHDDAMTLDQSVAYLLTRILRVLRELTHPDKLIAPAAANECEPLVTRLEKAVPAFSQTLVHAFKTKNKRVWRELEQAVDVVKGLYLAKGLAFFSTHFQHQSHDGDADSVKIPLATVRRSATRRKQSQKDPRPSVFFAAASAETRAPKKTLRDLASQLRHVHLHQSYAQAHAADVAERLNSRSSIGSRLLARTGPANFRHSIKSKNSKLLSSRSERDVMPVSASAYLHQYAASKSEWRMLSPHVSLWSLSQVRVPDWHSYERMVAPTSLNHFLLQPIERLQVYCAVHQFFKQKLKKLQRHVDLPAQPLSLPVASPESSARVRSASSMVSEIMGFSKQKSGDTRHGSARQLLDGEPLMPSKNEQPLPAATKEAMERGPSFSPAVPEKRASVLKTLWDKIFNLSDHANRLAIVQKALTRAPEIEDFDRLEAIRARRLLKYHLMDPFDAASRLQRLYQDAKRLPRVLYREGIVATLVHVALWVLLTVTVWRVSIARDAVRDSERSFQELHSSQMSGDDDHVHELVRKRAMAKAGLKTTESALRDLTPFIVISDRPPRHQLLVSHMQRVRRHQVAPSTSATVATRQLLPSDEDHDGSSSESIVLSQQELKHLVVLLELRSLVSDIFRVWPSENGNIGLNGFWSSMWFTGVALGSPFLFVYGIFPWVVQLNPEYTRYLSYVACAYGTAWILAAYVSIRGVTKKIPAFREVRHVEKINLTTLPYCVRNYMAIASVIWEGFQLNTTSFEVWEMSYQPKQLAALTTVDLQDIGLGSLRINLFESKQTLALVCLLVWFFCLKASNKFKSMQYLNYLLTFLLPNLLGGMLFMFLSKQFYQTAACFENAQNVTVMWANSDITCWTDPAHTTYALRGMFGMSIFVPLAVLAYGSYQVFFPEINLDVQTSPLLNVSSQIVKAAMMGALTFFVNQVHLFLAVALVGNLLLLFLVTKYDLCSTWHLKYGKVLIYAMSSWSAFCAMASTFVRENKEKVGVPLDAMHIGWGVLVVLWVALVRRRSKRNQRGSKENKSTTAGRHVLIKQQDPKSLIWRRKVPSIVAPVGEGRQEKRTTSPELAKN